MRISRTASAKIPPAWKKKPSQTNLISPREARDTPKTMKRTLRRTFSFGEATPKSQEVRRMATGALALSIWINATLR